MMHNPDRAQGLELASWDIQFDPHRASRVINFAWLKITEGYRHEHRIWIEPRLDELTYAIREIPVRGAIHYQRACMDWVEQATYFIHVAGRYSFHVLALEVEKIYNVDEDDCFSDRFFVDTRNFIDYCRAAAPRRIVMLRCSQDTYDRCLAPAILRLYGDEGLKWLESIPLWLIQPYNQWLQNEPRSPIKRKTPWAMWQFTDKGQPEEWGTAQLTNASVFNGTPASFASWVANYGDADPTATNGGMGQTEKTQPLTEPTTYIAQAIVPERLPLFSMPLASHITEDHLAFKEKVSGRLWIGHDHVWMKLDEHNLEGNKGKWVQIRRLKDGKNFFALLAIAKSTDNFKQLLSKV